MLLKLPRSIDPEKRLWKSQRKGELSPWFCQMRLASWRRRILLSSMSRTTEFSYESFSKLSARSYDCSLPKPELLSAFERVSVPPTFFLILKSLVCDELLRLCVAELGEVISYLQNALSFLGCQALSNLGLGSALSGERHCSSAC